MITDKRLKWLAGPDYVRSEAGQIAAALLTARAHIAALEAALRIVREELVSDSTGYHLRHLAIIDSALENPEVYETVAELIEALHKPSEPETPVEPIDCAGCGGTGYVSTGIDEMPTERCKRCGGLGSVQKIGEKQ